MRFLEPSLVINKPEIGDEKRNSSEAVLMAYSNSGSLATSPPGDAKATKKSQRVVGNPP